MGQNRDLNGYERRLTSAKALVEEALQRSQEGTGASNWKDCLDAHAARLAEEHRLHALDLTMAEALKVAQKRLVADWQ